MIDNNFSDSNNLCMGCMRPRGAEKTCPECGWVEGTLPDSPLYLPPRTELNNRYVIGRVLGHGGFGITYLGWDKELHLKVAIKEYLPDGLGTRALGDRTVSVYSGQYGQDFEYGLEKFLDEARTLARFQSNPNIVSIMNFFKENGTAYIVMEYVEGISLRQYLQQKADGRMPLDEALTYIMPVADALSLVHAEGILHRDISPDNIYVTKDYKVKLLDFGASRKAMSDVNKSLSVLLKPGYAPVEQYSSRGVQGPWTDEYALAATFYKLLSGKTPPESIDRMQGAELESFDSLGVEVPESVEALLNKALAVQPGERHQSIQEFRTELNNALSINEINKIKESPVITETKPGQDGIMPSRPEPTGSQSVNDIIKPLPEESKKRLNKKTIIALVAVLIIALPAVVYGFVNAGRFKSNQVPSVNIAQDNKNPSQAKTPDATVSSNSTTTSSPTASQPDTKESTQTQDSQPENQKSSQSETPPSKNQQSQQPKQEPSQEKSTAQNPPSSQSGSSSDSTNQANTPQNANSPGTSQQPASSNQTSPTSSNSGDSNNTNDNLVQDKTVTLSLSGTAVNTKLNVKAGIAFQLLAKSDGTCSAKGSYDNVNLFGKFDVPGTWTYNKNAGEVVFKLKGQIHLGDDGSGFPSGTTTDYAMILLLKKSVDVMTGEYVVGYLPNMNFVQPGELTLGGRWFGQRLW